MLIPDKNKKSPTGQITHVKRYSDPSITVVVSDDELETAEAGEEPSGLYVTAVEGTAGETTVSTTGSIATIGLDTEINLTVDERFRYLFMMSAN